MRFCWLELELWGLSPQRESRVERVVLVKTNEMALKVPSQYVYTFLNKQVLGVTYALLIDK